MKVTGFVKHDLYPHYLVMVGELQENFDLKCRHGTYNRSEVLAVKPLIEYETHRQTHERIRAKYRQRERELRVALLEAHGVDFVKVN